MSRSNRGRLLAAAAIVIAQGGVAHAQSAATDAAPAPDIAQPTDRLGDIVVTARRTSENLQRTPVAVTALPGSLIEQLNIQDVRAVPQFTPNLTISVQSGSLTSASIYIRGIGNQEPSAVAEQGVGVYLDGVYVARSAAVIFDLVDVERIEVLRGPQGTLFGRNTVGGALQIVSRKPTDNPHFEVKGGYGRYQDWFARARVDTGNIGGSPIKVALSYLHRERNGYFNNTLFPSDEDPGALNAEAATAAVRGEFGDLTADYMFDYNQRTGTPPYFQNLIATPDATAYYGRSLGLGGAPFQVGLDRLGSGQQAPIIDRNGRPAYGVKARIWGHALTLNYDVIPGVALKSITSYRKFHQNAITILYGAGDLKGVVLDPVTFAPSVQSVALYGNDAQQRQHQFSQELQLLGKTGDISYVAGLYYFRERASESGFQRFTFLLPGGMAGLNLAPVQEYEGTSKSYAAFGQASYTPGGGNLELTGGLRYTADRKTIELRGDINPSLFGKVRYDNLSWLASVNYRFTPTVMSYVRVSTGFRSGGINPRTSTINIFDPEKARAYEAGLKAEWFDRRLRTNLALFYTDYRNLQVQQFASGSGGATSNIVNAGKVNYKGVELEVTALPARGLTLDGSLGYTDPKYKTFLFRDPATDAIINVADEARLPQAAKFNARVGGEYAFDAGLGTASARLDYAYRSTIYFFALDRVNPFNRTIRSRPDHNLRARLGLSNIAVAGGELAVGLWADNLTNDRNIDFGIDFGGLGFGSGSYKRPRTFGVDARLTY